MYQILNNVSPTENEVREWGFNEDSLFTEQDEDLILYSNNYVGILFELACNMECPKNEYCLSILSNYSKTRFLANDLTSIEEIASVIEDRKITLPARYLKWAGNFHRCKTLLYHPQIIDLNDADYIAHYLLSGDEDSEEIKRSDRTLSGFIEYVKSGSYKSYLYINLEDSRWKFSKFQRLSD